MEVEKVVLVWDNSMIFCLVIVFGMVFWMWVDLLVNDFVYCVFYDWVVVIFEGYFKCNYIYIWDVVKVFFYGLENFEFMKGKFYNVGLEDVNLFKLEFCVEICKYLFNFVYLEVFIGEDLDKWDYIVFN